MDEFQRIIRDLYDYMAQKPAVDVDFTITYGNDRPRLDGA